MSLIDEQELIEITKELSIRYFQKPFKHKVIYNHRLRTTGGRYLPKTNTIEINPLYRETDYDEFIGIIKHELCHYHLHIEGKGFNHRDQSFKDLLAKTGAPRFCRPLYENENLYKYKYECLQCKHLYRRTRRVNLNRVCCGKCKGQLRLLR